MQAKVKLFGHPVHQMLIPIPLGLFIVATLFDVLFVLHITDVLTSVSYWNIVAGVVGGLVAAIFGLLDWWGIPRKTRANRIGALHGIGNAIVVALFFASLMIRSTAIDYAPTTLPLVLELIGLGLGAITGWLGGELVDRLGVGVDIGAHVNAPSSLTHVSARR